MNSKIKLLISISLMLFLAAELNAIEIKRTVEEASNLKQAIYCMEILENRPDLEPSHRIRILRNKCYSENFIEHAPNIEDGKEALLSIFEKRFKKYPELSMSIKRTASEGDLVWIHLHVKHTPDSLGAAGIHIFRMKEGKIVEHWGVNQRVAEKSKNDNTMF